MVNAVSSAGRIWLNQALPDHYNKVLDPEQGQTLVAGRICDLATTRLEVGHAMLDLIRVSGHTYPAWGDEQVVVWLLQLGGADLLEAELAKVGAPQDLVTVCPAGEQCTIPAAEPAPDADPRDPVWLVAPVGRPGGLITALTFARTLTAATQEISATHEGLPASPAVP